VLGSENLFQHSYQQKGFSPQCVRLCLVKLLSPENLFFHTPGNKKVFLQNVFVSEFSGGWHGKIFSKLLATKAIFSTMCSLMLGQAAGTGKSFSTFLKTTAFLSSRLCIRM